MSPIAIRSFEPEDIAAVARLEEILFPEPWSEMMLRDELEAAGRTYLISADGTEIVGYGGVMLIGSDAHIMTLAVVPAARRRGVGSQLMLSLVDAAIAAGAEHLTLELRVSNEPARALYEKFGFAPVGIRPRYYRDEDALVMWALDVHGPEYRAALDRIRREAA
jgi:ribosomal-protein-alanine N-acetyltransferase